MNTMHLLINGKQVFEMISTKSLFRHVDNWSEFLGDYFGVALKHTLDVKFKNGMKLELRPHTTDKWSVHEVILRDDYHLPMLPDNAVVLDIGACEGAFAVHTAYLNPRVKMYALEPNELNFQLLKENVAQNKLKRKIRLFKLGLARRSGSALLFLASDRRAHTFTANSKLTSTKVKTISLSNLFELCKIKRCDLMKMDIEGAEYDIFYHLSDSILYRIQKISMEYHNQDEYKKNGTFLAAHLKNKGYQVEYKDTIDHSVGHLYATRINDM